MGPAASIVIADRDVARFAAASGDHNPLHGDPLFSRTTPFGRPIVHGALIALAMCARLRPKLAADAGEWRAVFRQPVLPGASCESKTEEHGIRLFSGAMELMSLICKPGASAGASWAALHEVDSSTCPPSEAEPRVLDAGAIESIGEEGGEYRPDWQALDALAHDYGETEIPATLLAAFAWASYWTGMRTPGRDALLSGIRVRRVGTTTAAAHDTVRYAAQAPRFHRRTGAVTLSATLSVGAEVMTVEIDSFLRHAVPQATTESLARFIRPGARLEGRTVVVIGGARGLGRALALAMVLQGARVLVVHRHSAERIVQMQETLGTRGERLISVACDAEDGAALAAALSAWHGTIDGLVLAASPPIPTLALDISTTAQATRHIDACMKLAWNPIAACAARMGPNAFLVALSSSAVEQAPPYWPHYVSAKMAVEGLARYAAQHLSWHVTIARPPRLWTELTTTVTGHIGATPVELVAARIVQRVLVRDVPPAHRPRGVDESNLRIMRVDDFSESDLQNENVSSVHETTVDAL